MRDPVSFDVDRLVAIAATLRTAGSIAPLLREVRPDFSDDAIQRIADAVPAFNPGRPPDPRTQQRNEWRADFVAAYRSLRTRTDIDEAAFAAVYSSFRVFPDKSLLTESSARTLILKTPAPVHAILQSRKERSSRP